MDIMDAVQGHEHHPHQTSDLSLGRRHGIQGRSCTDVSVRALKENIAVEVLRGQAGDGHAHQDVSEGQVEDEAPVLTALSEEHLQRGGCHQQAGGDDKSRGGAQDRTHHPESHLTQASHRVGAQ